jgi:hypothetical protein
VAIEAVANAIIEMEKQATDVSFDEIGTQIHNN